MNSNTDLYQDDMPRIDKAAQAGQTVSHEQEELGPKLHSLSLTTETELAHFLHHNRLLRAPSKFRVVVPKIISNQMVTGTFCYEIQGGALVYVVLCLSCTKAHNYLAITYFPSH